MTIGSIVPSSMPNSQLLPLGKEKKLRVLNSNSLVPLLKSGSAERTI